MGFIFTRGLTLADASACAAAAYPTPTGTGASATCPTSFVSNTSPQFVCKQADPDLPCDVDDICKCTSMHHRTNVQVPTGAVEGVPVVLHHALGCLALLATQIPY
jgi:hypothetical protein